jgi:hypothetical protein
MVETRDETVAQLRKRLGREPTKKEMDAVHEEIIRRAYADMAAAAVFFRDESQDPGFGAANDQPEYWHGPCCVRGSKSEPRQHDLFVGRN